MHRTLLTIIITALLAGCAPLVQEQHLPAQGFSVRQAIALQTLNPDAGGTAPVLGLDGRYAQQTIINYQEMPLPAKEAESEDLGSVFKVGDSK